MKMLRKPIKPESWRQYERLYIPDLFEKDTSRTENVVTAAKLVDLAVQFNVKLEDLVILYEPGGDWGNSVFEVAKIITVEPSPSDLRKYEQKLSKYNKWLEDNKEEIEKIKSNKIARKANQKVEQANKIKKEIAKLKKELEKIK